MSANAETPTNSAGQSLLDLAVKMRNSSASRRRWKETLLPQIAQLALEGHSGETIARKVGMPSRTIRHWLQGLREEWMAESAAGAAEMFSVALARLNAIYREAMEEWRNSQRDIEVRLVEDTEVASESRSTIQKRSVRTQPQRRNAALLSRATAAAKAMFDLKLRAAAAQVGVAGPRGEAIPDEALTPDDLTYLSYEDLNGTELRLRVEAAADGKPDPEKLLTPEDYPRMSDDALLAREARLQAEIEADDAAADSPPDSDGTPPDCVPKKQE